MAVLAVRGASSKRSMRSSTGVRVGLRNTGNKQIEQGGQNKTSIISVNPLEVDQTSVLCTSTEGEN